MTVRHAFFLLIMTAAAAQYCEACPADTASVRSGYQPRTDSVQKKIATPMVLLDTAVVRTYNGIPVFYNCKPLHAYTRVGFMTRTTLVSYLTQAFERYTKVARRKAKGHLGIIINNMNFGIDSFDVVRFSPVDGNADTAVFAKPIFLSARPTRPYKVVRIIKDQFGAGSLNVALQGYFEDAKRLHVPFDGIMLKDVNYAFARDNVYVFRWRK